MTKGNCPQCGCNRFFIKDPDDPFETYQFEVKNGRIQFDDNGPSSYEPNTDEDTEAFCDRCAWHDRLRTLG
jgi:hypothetical protein